MSLRFLIFGAILGLTFSVAMVSAAVWTVQITVSRGALKGMVVALALALAQLPLAWAGGWLVLSLHEFQEHFDWVLRGLAATTLFYMAAGAFQASRLRELHYAGPLAGTGELFRRTLVMALTMPLRLPGFIALFLAVNLHYTVLLYPEARPWIPVNALLLALGVALGAVAWLGYFTLLAALFAKRVPEPVSLKSLNKLRMVAGLIYTVLGLIALAPMLPGFR